MTRVAVAAGSLFVPLALLFLNIAHNGGGNTGLVDHGFLMKNWLYMAAPQLIVIAVSVGVKSARRIFLPFGLGVLSFALVVFQGWIWWFVPPRESGLAWVSLHSSIFDCCGASSCWLAMVGAL
ncbi:MAG: hypothetical protein HEQ37_07600 [Acidovorax sp.]|nr:hypothetical protein [Acidovorax sp.]